MQRSSPIITANWLAASNDWTLPLGAVSVSCRSIFVMSRIAGISLIALGIACWPGRGASWALYGMLTYSFLVKLYLIYLGVGGEWTGKLLWPAVAVHAVLTILLAGAWFNAPKTPEVNT